MSVSATSAPYSQAKKNNPGGLYKFGARGMRCEAPLGRGRLVCYFLGLFLLFGPYRLWRMLLIDARAISAPSGSDHAFSDEPDLRRKASHSELSSSSSSSSSFFSFRASFSTACVSHSLATGLVAGGAVILERNSVLCGCLAYRPDC